MKEYKVLSQSDSFWRDRFSPLVLEDELNKFAAKGWRLVSATTTEFTGLGGLGSTRHEMFFILERDAVDTGQQAPAQREQQMNDDYDAGKIPGARFYANVGNISTTLQQKGLVTKEQMNRAREEFARRGGHLCDHLLALGYVTETDLRALLGKG